MQVTVSHPTYGFITYEESAWTGKKKIAFDGIPLQKINKTTFQYQPVADDPFAHADASAETAAETAANNPAEPLTVTVKGSYVGGVSLLVNGETITLTAKASVLDIVLGVIPAVLFFCLIIGGAIGGGLGALIGMGLTILNKNIKKPIYKILICLGISLTILAIGIPLLLAMIAAQTV